MTPCFNTYNQQEKSMDLKDSYIYEFIKERNIGDISLKSCKKGSVITDGADDRIHVIFLLEGAIKVVTTSIEGKQILIDEVCENSFSGHISKVRGQNFFATVIAKTNCIYLDFPDKVFDELMKNQDFACFFYKSTSDRVYLMYRKLLAKELFSQEEMIAYYLLSKADKEDLVALSKYYICEAMGISRRNFYNIINRFYKNGWVKKEGMCVRIIRGDELERVSNRMRWFFAESSI
jgi:CRP-like cAMP-binding protein